MIIIDSDHIPTPFGYSTWTKPQHCAYCPQPVYHVEKFGWVHHTHDITMCACTPDHQCHGPEQ